MRYDKRPAVKFAISTLSRMPCMVSDVPVAQRSVLRELEKREMAFFDGVQWNKTPKGEAAQKLGIVQ
jgi:hypothetical protein